MWLPRAWGEVSRCRTNVITRRELVDRPGNWISSQVLGVEWSGLPAPLSPIFKDLGEITGVLDS